MLKALKQFFLNFISNYIFKIIGEIKIYIQVSFISINQVAFFNLQSLNFKIRLIRAINVTIFIKMIRSIVFKTL